MKSGIIDIVRMSDMQPYDSGLRLIEPGKNNYLGKNSIPSGYEEWNEDWAIAEDGSMIFQNHYRIDSERLDESDWILHLMTTKNWFDANTFIPAYFEACRRARKKNVTIQTYY